MTDEARRSDAAMERPTFVRRGSFAGRDDGGGFARERDCGKCHKGFNLLRRRHHCRGCHVAVCKDCGRKAVRRGVNTKPQWYCHECIAGDDEIEVVGGGRATLHKRMSISSGAFGADPPSINTLASVAKFCIECGYELPNRVKFCIECGTAVKPTLPSPVPGQLERSGSEMNRASRSLSRGFPQAGNENLMMIDEQSDDPTDSVDGLEEELTVESDGRREESESSPQSEEDAAAVVHAESSKISEELLAQLQAENEKLRRKVERLRVKVVQSEQYREETVEQYKQALAVAEAQAQTAATAAPPASAPGALPIPATSAAAAPSASSGSGVTAKDHSDYAKFFKLLTMGLPAEQVKMKMQQAGVDPNVLDNPDAVVGGAAPAPVAGGAAAPPGGGILVKDDEKYAKFFKLTKMGMPAEQVKLKMSAEGLDPNLLDTPDAIMPGSGGAASAPSGGMTVKDDPAYEKFFKLAKMGMPAEQIKMKMSAAGLNPDYLDTPDAPSPNQKGGTGAGGMLAGLPPPAEAVKVDSSALQASLASKLQRGGSQKKPEEPALPKKDPVKPNVELRPFFWTRVPVNVVKSTIWMKLDDSHADFDPDEMEWMFRKNPVDASKKQDEAKKKEAAKDTAPPLVLLLDPKRQQNVSIAIARFRMSATEIKDAIYSLNNEVLTSEVLNVLISISPTSEEQDLLKNYDGDEKLLGNVEKFFLELLTIPRYTQRIKCIRYKFQFENRILETQAQLDTLQAATDQVTDSEKFRRVLEHILAIGNYLNGSTPRGGAYGFKLDTLTKLHALKSVDPRVTLMNFLLRQLEERAPEVIAFAGELPHITEAKRLSLDQLRADLSGYNSELAMLQGQVRAAKSDKIDEDKFYTEMAPFAKDAAEVLEELGRDYGTLESSYQELLTSFGEDPRKCGPMEFFAIVEEFVNEFKKAYRQNQTKEYQAIFEAAKQAREDALAAVEAEKAAQLAKEEEERAQREAEERAKRAAEEDARLMGGSEDSRALYMQIIATVTNWAQAHVEGDPSVVVDQFKAISRSFGIDEITADEFCTQVRQIFGSKVALKVIPNSAKLLSSPGKRKDLLIAFDRFSEQVKKAKEEKKKNGLERQKSKPRRSKVSVMQVPEIEPVVGEAAQQLHKSILESVQHAFGGDTKKMKVFTSNARKYGTEQISARDFYQYLTASFDMDFVGRLVPDLARLLQDAEKRHALIRALCESAAGWEKFSGL
ncbi:hypothetical protein Poli38472_014055 [Pythium oligandrum]|uniref:Formin-like protein n=1 Tax=Pythium oligandrum TaxID=41045 RepID=A0A8K1CQY3_PYTOL|nr:hypothetical protein Poli38472_014055 [Pythium oligandrum]|eukprot:TMW66743.1 hypothetical protein Poli38472_014055 [Pythium oligandrum]